MKKIHILFDRVVIWASALVLSAMVLLSLLQIRTKDSVVEGALSNPLVSVAVVVTSGFILFMVLMFLYNVLNKCKDTTLNIVSYITMAVIVTIQAILLIYFVRAIPQTDAYRNITTAMKMARDGVLSIDNTVGYYAGYANNNGFVIMMYGFYSILLKLGITDLWTPTIVLNVLFIDLGIFFSYLFARKAFSRKSATYFMILALISPTTYCFLTFAYTNTFSIFFVALLLWMSLYVNKEKAVHSCLYCVAMGIVAAIGYVIRPTTIIVIIALSIMLLRVFDKKKLAIAAMAIFVISFALCNKMISDYNCQYVVDKSFSKAYPITHWIMLGVSEKGGYNPEDYAYTKSFPTKEEKIEGNIKEIKSRIKKSGPIGMGVKWLIKLRRVWADGNDESYNMNICTDNSTIVYDYMHGQKNGMWSIYAQAYRFITIFAIFALAVSIRKKNEDEPLFLLLLTLFGAIVFFLIWEANNKYSISFSLIMALLMERGLEFCSEIRTKVKTTKMYKIAMLVGVICLILGNTALYMKYSDRFTDKTYEFKDYSHQDYMTRGGVYIYNIIREGKVITQTFKWEKDISSIGLLCNNIREANKNATYQITIYDKKEKIISKKVTVEDIEDDDMLWLHLEDQKLEADKTYTLEYKGIKGKSDSFGLVSIDASQIDYINTGNIYINNKKSPEDLYMITYNSKNVPYTTNKVYYAMYGILLIFLYIVIHTTLKEKNTLVVEEEVTTVQE